MSRPVIPFRVFLPILAALILCFGHGPAQAGQPTVELYVTSWCPYCKKAEAYFNAKGVAYTAHDIEKDAGALKRFQQYGAQGVPLVIIGGTPIAGYSIEEYDRALSRK